MKTIAKFHLRHFFQLKVLLQASVAHLDAHPNSDQEVAGWTPARSATFFLGDLIIKYFLCSFSPSADSNCKQWRPRSDAAIAASDQGLHCLHMFSCRNI